ncbi:proline racemase family protein [Kibdelosporangium phytohabitans]|uniref:Proline racemase n=1 Tax=Kibdelosporangium phytohabitans TaxID=860235 RepID=A0A0N9HUD4_9PSEU|nr:proline racemase family protein [Kibdelosporangium phytohabitans]ALG07112.1 proline racemase [Kibdelosporangium phytohabitans]MBE1468429.1 proline racemase [Kibdelosporangium phytohabitans]
MRASRYFTAVDSHTEGMPTRVITGGVGVIPGDTMAGKRAYFVEHLDHIRQFLVNEPRGHAAMSGAILQPPTRPDADTGVIYIEVSGCLPMCGHGTIGVATVLVETGMVDVVEPVTTVRLDTPAGLVVAEVQVHNGRAESVTIENVPSFALELDAAVTVPGIGEVRYDMAYGGNFYAVLPIKDLGIPFEKSEKDRMLTAGLRIMAAINAERRPTHPEDPRINGCKHVQLVAPGTDGSDARNAMVIHPGWFDRSPCGTGTSARMAQLHARGELGVGQDFINESLLGTAFTGRLTKETTVGSLTAVIPAVTGRAWITGMAQYLLDPTDPFPTGFTL